MQRSRAAARRWDPQRDFALRRRAHCCSCRRDRRASPRVRLIAGLLLALGPFFVAFLLFDGTRGLFEGWVRGARRRGARRARHGDRARRRACAARAVARRPDLRRRTRRCRCPACRSSCSSSPLVFAFVADRDAGRGRRGSPTASACARGAGGRAGVAGLGADAASAPRRAGTARPPAAPADEPLARRESPTRSPRRQRREAARARRRAAAPCGDAAAAAAPTAPAGMRDRGRAACRSARAIAPHARPRVGQRRHARDRSSMNKHSREVARRLLCEGRAAGRRTAQDALRASRRIAWIVAGVAAAIAVLRGARADRADAAEDGRALYAAGRPHDRLCPGAEAARRRRRSRPTPR